MAAAAKAIDAQIKRLIFVSLPASGVAGRAEQSAKRQSKQKTKSQRKQPVTGTDQQIESAASGNDSGC
jgi:hypothetical protein